MALSFIACDTDVSTLSANNSGQITCFNGSGFSKSNGWIVQTDTSQLLASFDYSTLDPQLIAGFFGAGFSIIAMFAVLGIVVGKVLQLIKNG